MPPTPEKPAYSRDETTSERLDRNWNDLLQELRVMQTGVQLLTGFLLTIPFQSRFNDLADSQINLFLVLVVIASLATVLLLTVVMLHRALFGKRAKHRLVEHADKIVRGTVVLIGVLLLGVCVLIFDVVLGPHPALLVAGILVVVVLALWFVYPTLLRRTASADQDTVDS